MRNRLFSTIAATVLAVSVAGCEGRTSGFLSTGPSGDVRVRVLNAVTSSQAIDFLVDGQVVASAIPLGAASAFAQLTLGSHRLQVRSNVTGTILLDFARDLSSRGTFSLVPAPGLSQFGALLIPDDPVPSANQARIRVVHAAAAPGAVSVFVTAPTADLGGATPLIPLLEFGTASAYIALPPGAFRVRVTRADTGELLLDSGSVTLAGGTVRTLLLTDAPGGGLPTSLSFVTDAP